MADVTAICDRSFRAYHTSGQRSSAIVKWIVLHDEEASSAESAARYFTGPGAGGSAHLCVDDQHCFRCLPNNMVAWGAASAIGANLYGFHIEQAGFAKWSLVLWTRHRDTLRRAAYKTALHCIAFEVPPVWRGANDLTHLLPGVTTHAQVSAASRVLDPANAGRYSHSDPGLLWPRRLFMRYVRQYHAQLTS